MTRFIIFTLLLLGGSAAHAARNDVKGNPVQKVLALLERMQEQIQTEGKTEAAAYDKFACFCKEQADDKMYRITKGKEKIDMLSSKIEVLETEIADLDTKTDQAKEDIKTLEGEMEDEDNKRSEGFDAYKSDWEDLQDAIERLEEAIADMSGSKDQMSGAGVKKSAALLSKEDSASIAELDSALTDQNQTVAKKEAAMLATASQSSIFKAPAPKAKSGMESEWKKAQNWRHRSLQLIATGKVDVTKEQSEMLLSWANQKQPAFEFSSNKHIEIVEELLRAYKQQQYERETEEAGDKHKYMMTRNANQHNLDSLIALKTKLETTSAAKTEEKGAAEKEREETQADVDADQGFLDELTADCEDKAKAWDSRSHVRSNELTAIAKALEILKAGVAGNYESNRMALISEDEDAEDDEDDSSDDAFLFLQRRKKGNKKARKQAMKAAKKRIQALLVSKSKSLSNDLLLSSMAMKVSENSFGKVKDLIGELIEKLKQEIKDAEEQSSWCKDEMEATTTKREEASANIAKSESAITLGKASIETLKGEVQELTDSISELYKALNEQQQLREAESAENMKTLEETRAGLHALGSAKEVLETFYNDPTALVQKSQRRARKARGPDADGNEYGDVAPESDSWTEENAAKGDEGAGIIDLLTTIGGDFERTIENTEKGEDDASKDFEKFKTDTEKDIDEKKKSKETKEGEINDTDANVIQSGEDLDDAKAMKATAKDELEKLKPVCLDTGASFAERKARVESEIAALEEAMKIIDELG